MDTGAVLAITGICTAISGAIGSLLTLYFRNRKEQRADAIREWREITDKLQTDLNSSNTRITDLTTQIF
ncbi:MAG TPA: hypothetical protein VLA89_15495, partial [Gemmatimonadales bacterium]|nr:hypothetical protein [Gemmatimonadales bacterium]